MGQLWPAARSCLPHTVQVHICPHPYRRESTELSRQTEQVPALTPVARSAGVGTCGGWGRVAGRDMRLARAEDDEDDDDDNGSAAVQADVSSIPCGSDSVAEACIAAATSCRMERWMSSCRSKEALTTLRRTVTSSLSADTIASRASPSVTLRDAAGVCGVLMSMGVEWGAL